MSRAPPSPASSPVLFRAAEMSMVYDLPPLAYGRLVLANTFIFIESCPFLDLLQLVCSFAVPPQQVQGYCDYHDRKRLFQVGDFLLISYFKTK
jgi:hypothetical protein